MDTVLALNTLTRGLLRPNHRHTSSLSTARISNHSSITNSPNNPSTTSTVQDMHLRPQDTGLAKRLLLRQRDSTPMLQRLPTQRLAAISHNRPRTSLTTHQATSRTDRRTGHTSLKRVVDPLTLLVQVTAPLAQDQVVQVDLDSHPPNVHDLTLAQVVEMGSCLALHPLVVDLAGKPGRWVIEDLVARVVVGPRRWAISLA